jgi:hypothetical protein
MRAVEYVALEQPPYPGAENPAFTSPAPRNGVK